MEDRIDALEPPPGGWDSVTRDEQGFPLPRPDRIGYIAFESWIDHVCQHPGMVLRFEAWSAAHWSTLWEWIAGHGAVTPSLLAIREAGSLGGQTSWSDAAEAREPLLLLAPLADDAFIAGQVQRLTGLCDAALAARRPISWLGF